MASLSSQLGSQHLGSRDLSGSSQQLASASASVGVQPHTEGPENWGPAPMSLPEHGLRGHCGPSGSRTRRPARPQGGASGAGASSIAVPFISQKLSAVCKHQRDPRETAHSAKWGQPRPHRAAIAMKGNNASQLPHRTRHLLLGPRQDATHGVPGTVVPCPWVPTLPPTPVQSWEQEGVWAGLSPPLCPISPGRSAGPG